MLFLHPATREKITRILRRMKNGRVPAEEGCRQVLALDPFDAQALSRLGDLASTRKEWDVARRYYWQAIEASPSHSSAYAGLAETYNEAGDDPELAGSLLFLVYRRIFRDPEFEGAGREWYTSLPADSALAQFDEEDAIEMLCSLALQPLGKNESPRITEFLRPCRMVQHLIDLPGEGLSRETVDEILAHGYACAPLITGVLRDWARDAGFDDLPASMAVALLGEIGDPGVLPVILEAADAETEEVVNAAAWAAYRLAVQYPELQPRIAGMEVVGQSLTIYDFCCIAVEEDDPLSVPAPKAQPAPVPRLPVKDFDRIRDILMDFYLDNVDAREKRALHDVYFGPNHPRELNEDELSAFFDWILHDHTPRGMGRSLPLEYLARNHGALSQRDRRLLEGWANSRYSLFEVQRVETGRGVEVKDLLAGGVFFVHDVTSSLELVKWDCVLSRISDEDGKMVFAANGSIVSAAVRPRLLEWIAADREAVRMDWLPYLRAHSHRIRRACLKLYEEFRNNFKVATFEGDPVLFSSVTYAVPDRAALMEALRSSVVLHAEKGGSFVWTEPSTNRLLGTIKVSGGELKLECMSRERLERGMKLLLQLAGPGLSEKSRTFRDVSEVMRDLPAGSAPQSAQGIPPEVQKELIGKYMEEHFRKWPDMELPALGGLTPRQAAQRPDAREKLRELLKDFENGELRKRKAGEPFYEISRLRAELGIDD